jgi:hypothetical protein
VDYDTKSQDMAQLVLVTLNLKRDKFVKLAEGRTQAALTFARLLAGILPAGLFHPTFVLVAGPVWM